MDNDEKIKEYEAHKTPVPSYDEYMTMKDCAKAVFEAAQRETKLKELLKECRRYIQPFIKDFTVTMPNEKIFLQELLTKINEVLKMNVKYCDFCPQSGKCEHEDKGYECAIPVKLLYLENQKLRYTIREICKELEKRKSYESKIIAIKGLINKC